MPTIVVSADLQSATSKVLAKLTRDANASEALALALTDLTVTIGAEIAAGRSLRDLTEYLQGRLPAGLGFDKNKIAAHGRAASLFADGIVMIKPRAKRETDPNVKDETALGSKDPYAAFFGGFRSKQSAIRNADALRAAAADKGAALTLVEAIDVCKAANAKPAKPYSLDDDVASLVRRAASHGYSADDVARALLQHVNTATVTAA